MSYVRSSHGPGASPTGESTALPADGDLAAALHEVSNALTIVLGWLEEAREASEGNDRAEHAIEVALSRALLGRNLARRAIGAKVLAREEETDLASLVHDAVRGVEREAARSGVALSVRMRPEAAGACVRDLEPALQILTNLLLNAIAMGSRSIVVETIAGPEEGKISIIDDGPGVEPARRETIFDGGPSSRPGGAGLGLPHARVLARESGGTLSLVPSARGAHFELTWPLSAPRSGVVRPAQASRSLEGLRVAILDDDDAILDLLSISLGIRGVTVQTARTISQLDALVAKERIDAVLIDLSPIAQQLVPTLHRIREQNPACKIILISGTVGGLPKEAEELSSAWVRKPFEVGELVAVLSDVMRKHDA